LDERRPRNASRCYSGRSLGTVETRIQDALALILKDKIAKAALSYPFELRQLLLRVEDVD